MFRVPAAIWKRNVQRDARRVTARLEFMGTDHHLIRNFVVIELAKTQQPLSAESIAESLGLEPKRVVEVLDELEAQRTFIYRTDGGTVDWAYPVTVENTSHQVTLDNGDRFFAA